MKKFYFIILFAGIFIYARAQDPAYPPAPPTPQNIVGAEYFFDTDPGFGNGIAISITPGLDLNNVATSINTTGLGNGIHRLSIRARNNEGGWSITAMREFLVNYDPGYTTAPAAPQNITAAEYFIDTDPGFGNGTVISITPGLDLNNIVSSINTTGLGNGIHRFYIRSKNNEGRWAITNIQYFLIDFDPVYPATPAAPQNIIAAEYFIDTDPGIGSGMAVSITPALDINNISINPSLVGLSNGIHRFYLRTKNNEGHWGITNIKDFLYDADPAYTTEPAAPGNVILAEYFFDTDPGFGNGTLISVTPGVDISNISFLANISALPDGSHKFFIRSLDDWSITGYKVFAKGAGLPVRLLEFSVLNGTNSVTLEWKTSSEINNSGFEIERSADGAHWTTLIFVPATTAITAVKKYSWEDKSPGNGRLYYRLKQLDVDGNFEYSKVLTLNRTKQGSVIIYPNPVRDILQIKFTDGIAKGEVELFNSSGQRVAEKGITAATISVQLDVKKLPAGSYVLKIRLPEGEKSYPVVIQ